MQTGLFLNNKTGKKCKKQGGCVYLNAFLPVFKPILVMGKS